MNFLVKKKFFYDRRVRVITAATLIRTIYGSARCLFGYFILPRKLKRAIILQTCRTFLI